MHGIIFDIQRCSLHDGPGIRTTVFLKGCPLRCAWCHNPESIAFAPEILYQAERCIDCGACVAVCHHDARRLDDNGHQWLERANCAACGTCIGVCQGEAVRLVGERRSVDDVMEVVLRDRAYYERSGGGVTLSGGEPMAQFDFTLALLTAARTAGLHTCLETSGVAKRERYEEVLPLVDLFLYDYKATDPATHRDLIGVDNALVLANLDWLYQAGARIRLRCPLVPGVNDDEGHLAGIAAVAARYPNLVGVEIMAYHNMGVAKAAQIGRADTLTGVDMPAEAVRQGWIERLHALGCTVARLS